MASSSEAQDPLTLGSSDADGSPSRIGQPQTDSKAQPLSPSSPVEMSQLNSPRPELERFTTAQDQLTSPNSPLTPAPGDEQKQDQPSAVPAPAASETEDKSAPTQEFGLKDSTIESDLPHEDGEEKPISPVLGPSAPTSLTLTLLMTNGTRHNMRIDSKLLEQNNAANGQRDDPLGISVYSAKELVWRRWNEAWEPRPTSPSSIRLIHFGKILDDSKPLRDYKLTPAAPNVIHMSVKPDVIDDDENVKGHGHRRRGSGASASGGCCRCTVM